jgi:hypothetical protein
MAVMAMVGDSLRAINQKQRSQFHRTKGTSDSSVILSFHHAMQYDPARLQAFT